MVCSPCTLMPCDPYRTQMCYLASSVGTCVMQNPLPTHLILWLCNFAPHDWIIVKHKYLVALISLWAHISLTTKKDASICTWNSKFQFGEIRVKVVLAKTPCANYQHKSSLLENRENENFYFTFTNITHLPLLLHFFHLAWNLLLHPWNLSLPSCLYFSLLFSHFFFLISLINKSIKNQKIRKKKHTLGLIVSPPINTPMSKKMAYLAHELYY